MIEFDEQGNKLVLKLVYYGPALSGKTTNLLCLHDLLAPEGRGDLMTLDTKDDRTIFFDLLPFFLVAPSGLKRRVSKSRKSAACAASESLSISSRNSVPPSAASTSPT